MMDITRKSLLSGITRTRNIAITTDQHNDWKNGKLLQNVVPDLSVGDREFLISGITKEEWDQWAGRLCEGCDE